MHEAAIANSIIKIVDDKYKDGDFSKVNQIHVKVGKLTALVPECLEFAFEAVSRGTIAENAALIIEEIEARGHCLSCGAEFDADGYLCICEKCGSQDIKITGGEDLSVTSMDVEP